MADFIRWSESFSYSFAVDMELLGQLARAQALADVIREIPLPPKVQHHLHRLNIIRAVRGTTAIEGIEVSESELAAIVNAPGTTKILNPARHNEEQEVRNAYEAMTLIADTLEQEPNRDLTMDFILLLHQTITKVAQEEQASNTATADGAAAFRRNPVRVGTFLAPEPDAVPKLMEQFLAWVNAAAQKNLNVVLRAILAHYFFVSIHPFDDGNGRVARAIESFYLYQQTPDGGGINTRGFYSLANYYYQNRIQYFELLNQVRQHPEQEVGPLLRFAVRGLVEELQDLCQAVLQQIRIIAFRDYTRSLLSNNPNLRASNRSRLQRFLLALLELNTNDPKGVLIHQLRQGEGLLSALYGDVSSATLNRDLKYLKEEGLILVDDNRLRVNLDLMNYYSQPKPTSQKTQVKKEAGDEYT